MDYKKKAAELVAQMTLEEKASLMSGRDFWHLKGIERLDLPAIMVTDGPHGLRKQAADADHLGINQSVPATCFPTASATACSFDRKLMRRVGVALGEECRQEEVAVILGPGVNIKRSPLCGRNFEYISEDPYLTGELAAWLVSGIQSQHVGVSVKHYALNNQETRRMTSDSVVDERAMREIYLPAFEAVVKQSEPWTLMCAYNRVEGTYCSENKKLLRDILRDEWGFDGLVMTDWGASNIRPDGVAAGLDLQMPADGGQGDRQVVKAVQNGTLALQDLDRAAVNVTAMVLKSRDRKPMRYDVDAHHELARVAACESAVLLKNDDGMLPLPQDASFALLGAFAKKPRYQGAGSSKIAPIRLDNAYDTLTAAGVNFRYADGYVLGSDLPDEARIAEAVEAAKGLERVFIVAGLPDEYESEGFDRSDMQMPASHNRLIEAVAAANPNVTVILLGGAPVEMPWHDCVKGILLCYLGGEAGGRAIADLILGKNAPGGRLAETWPLCAADNPADSYFPGYTRTVEYRESIYVGYRYYDTAGKAVRYPFGHGLSYTSFEYGKLRLSENKIKDTDKLTVSLSVRNSGEAAGSEVVQLYVSHKKPSIFKAAQELRGFEKITLQPGESKTVEFKLDRRAFAYYNTNIADWHVESGEYEIRVGGSSRDIRQTGTVKVAATVAAEIPDYSAAAPCYSDLSGGIANVPDDMFRALLGREIPVRERQPGEPHTMNSTLSDIRDTATGRFLYNTIKKQAKKKLGGDSDIEAMADRMMGDMPLRALAMFAGDILTPRRMEGLLTMLNGSFFEGLGVMLKRERKADR